MPVEGPQTAGARLIEAIHTALPPDVEFDEREQALLAAAVHQADDIAALEADIRTRGHVIDGAVNPSVREARQGRLTLSWLLSGLDLPDSKSFTQLRGQRAAEARWARAS